MKNLEKFDLQKALDGAELVTRDGREVTEWHYFKTQIGVFPIIGVIDGNRETFTIEGKFSSAGNESPFDLFIKPKGKECWVNVYYNRDGSIGISDSRYSTKENAISMRLINTNYIKTIRITDEVEE